MKANNVDHSLQSRVRNYLEYCWEQEKKIKDDDVNDIDLILRLKICLNSSLQI